MKGGQTHNFTANLHMEKSIITWYPAPVALLSFYLKIKQTHYGICTNIFLILDIINNSNFMLTVYTCKLLQERT